MTLLFESLFNGAAIGSVLLIAALGLAIVFGLMGVINLAHGELMMLGAYTTYVVQSIFKLPLLEPLFGAYIFVAVVVAFLVSGLVGLLLERSVIRRLLWQTPGNPIGHMGSEPHPAAVCAYCPSGLVNGPLANGPAGSGGTAGDEPAMGTSAAALAAPAGQLGCSCGSGGRLCCLDP